MIEQLIGRAMAAGVPVKVHGRNAAPYAIVKDGVVIGITRWDRMEAPDWAPAEGSAVPCDESVAIGHLWDGARFTHNAVPLPPLQQFKAARVAAIDRAFRRASVGLFVDGARRETMRTWALAAVKVVSAAESHDVANAAANKAIAAITDLSQEDRQC